MSPKILLSSIALVVLLVIAFILFQYKETEELQTEYNPYEQADLTVEIIPAPNDTYGYNIKMNGRTLIYQPSVPALPGVEGFKTEEDAMRVGEFIMDKLRKNIFPPSVSVFELDSLEVK
jgi:hypothetical protein